MKQFNIKECRICGGTEYVTATQAYYGAVSGESALSGEMLHHIVCLNCGSVLHSYVEFPTRLLTREHRKQYEQAHGKGQT